MPDPESPAMFMTQLRAHTAGGGESGCARPAQRREVGAIETHSAGLRASLRSGGGGDNALVSPSIAPVRTRQEARINALRLFTFLIAALSRM